MALPSVGCGTIDTVKIQPAILTSDDMSEPPLEPSTEGGKGGRGRGERGRGEREGGTEIE